MPAPVGLMAANSSRLNSDTLARSSKGASAQTGDDLKFHDALMESSAASDDRPSNSQKTARQSRESQNDAADWTYFQSSQTPTAPNPVTLPQAVDAGSFSPSSSKQDSAAISGFEQQLLQQVGQEQENSSESSSTSDSSALSGLSSTVPQGRPDTNSSLVFDVQTGPEPVAPASDRSGAAEPLKTKSPARGVPATGANSQPANVTVMPPLVQTQTGQDDSSDLPQHEGDALDLPKKDSETATGASEPDHPRIDVSDGTTATVPGPIVLEAKLSPISTPDGGQPATPSALAPMAASTSTAVSDVPAQTMPETPAFKVEAAFQAAAVQDGKPSLTAAPQASQPKAAAPEEPVAVRMQASIETPSQPSGSRQVLTLDVPSGTNDAGVSLRFVDRGGEIHLSVRTPDVQLAQDLRGGLNDLVANLQHAGIRTEVSSAPGGESGRSGDPQQSAPDSKGSGRQQADAEGQQQPRDSRRAPWQEIYEDSPTPNKEQAYEFTR